MTDGPMTCRKRIIEENLLEKAMDDIKHAVEQDDAAATLKASKDLQEVVNYLPENMPDSLDNSIYTFFRLRICDITMAINSHRPDEAFVGECNEFIQLLIDEMNERGHQLPSGYHLQQFSNE